MTCLFTLTIEQLFLNFYSLNIQNIIISCKFIQSQQKNKVLFPPRIQEFKIHWAKTRALHFQGWGTDNNTRLRRGRRLRWIGMHCKKTSNFSLWCGLCCRSHLLSQPWHLEFWRFLNTILEMTWSYFSQWEEELYWTEHWNQSEKQSIILHTRHFKLCHMLCVWGFSNFLCVFLTRWKHTVYLYILGLLCKIT